MPLPGGPTDKFGSCYEDHRPYVLGLYIVPLFSVTLGRHPQAPDIAPYPPILAGEY
jgi:hypothetical protein